jgi:glycosyltransferase involved in cell wall biosynthesis
MIRAVKADWVIGFSDLWYGIWAQRLARANGVRSVIDAYDNYESYIPCAWPLHWFWRQSLAAADVLTAAGPQLADLMGRSARGKTAVVVPMAADAGFVPMDKLFCRQRLGLPLSGRLIGYTGALHPNRSIERLFAVFTRLREIDSRIELILSGRLARGVTVPSAAHWLGYRPPDEVPFILNCLDLLLVMNRPGAFGDYSYPAKIYEAMACGVPVVAADVAGTAWVLRDHPEMLAKAGVLDDFVSKATNILDRQLPPNYLVASWAESADIFEAQIIP